MTRGRDDNRVHVVTETTDPAEARDVLECVLAHDRADVPAVTQRRDLAHQIPPHEPAPVRRYEPTSILPDWVAPWRTQLEQQRDDLTSYLAHRADRRVEAATELADASTERSPRPAPPGSPTPNGSPTSKTSSAPTCAPPMWKANHDATHAGFGHRHGASRRAKDATERVDDAQSQIASIRADGADVKQRLDALEAEARNLHDLAHPSPAGYGLEQFNREQLDRIEPLLDAVDIWTTWARGRPVPTADLATAVSTLTDAARHSTPARRQRRRDRPHRNGSTRSSRSPTCSACTASNCPTVKTLNSSETVPSSASIYDSLGQGRLIDDSGTFTEGTR